MVGKGNILSFGIMRFGRMLSVPRMGSFTSTSKILNGDNQDNDFSFPSNISPMDLLRHCQTHAKSQQMLKRTFKRSSGCNSDVDYEIKFKKLHGVTMGCSDYKSDPYRLRILQWNILSQALGVMNDNFVKCPLDALEWSSRKYQIIEEFLEYSPDVICLQEVDHFNFLKNALGSQGYSGIFFPKPDSPCYYIDGNNGPDGCAIFYRNNKFALMESSNHILQIWSIQSNQVALLVNLRIKDTDEEMCVVTTHLKARKGALLATLRNEQSKDLLRFISKNANGRPVILCGDFNAEPTEPTYGTVMANMKSAYADCNTSSNLPSHLREPPYTTWKVREEGEMCHTIDYIFYNDQKLEVDAVLDFPSGKDIGINRIPSYLYPSDHFSLVCDFKINSSLRHF